MKKLFTIITIAGATFAQAGPIPYQEATTEARKYANLLYSQWKSKEISSSTIRQATGKDAERKFPNDEGSQAVFYETALRTLDELVQSHAEPQFFPDPPTEGIPSFEVIEILLDKKNNVAKWTVTIQNTSGAPIGNFRFQTFYSSKTGEYLESGEGEFKGVIKTKEIRTFEARETMKNGTYFGKLEVVWSEFIR